MSDKSSRIKKEEIYVGLASEDNTSIEYHDVTRYVNSIMPLKNPKATCALRVTNKTAAFSLLLLTKQSAKSYKEKPLEFPKGPLIRLEKHSLANTLTAENQILVEFGNDHYNFTYTTDHNGVITLDGESSPIELPKNALQVSIFLKSPIVDRVVALGFIGHLGRPGDIDNILRITSKIIRYVTGFSHFRALTGFESVEVPPAPRVGSTKVTRKTSDKAFISFPAYLLESQSNLEPVASGLVKVEVNLDIPGSGNSRILLNLEPSPELEPFFEPYRLIINSTIYSAINAYLGDAEIRSIAADIALGEVGPGTVMRFRDALLTIPQLGFYFTPTGVAPYEA